MANNTLQHLLGLSSFEMLAMFRRGLFYAFLSIYLRHHLGLSVTETTLFATLPMAVNILAQTFIWGRISDRFQLRRSLIIAGELLAGVGTAIVWFIHRLPDSPTLSGYTIIAGLTVIELFWSMSNISWSALISDIYAVADRSRVQGQLTSMGGIGRIAGVWIGGLLYDGLGLKYAGWGFYEGPLFFVAASIMVVSTLPLLLLPEGGVGANPAKANDSANEQTGQVRFSSIYLVFLAGMVFINFGRNSIAIIFTQYLTLSSGLAVDSQSLSYIVNTQSLAIVLFGWMAGWIAKQWGNGPTLITGTLVALGALLMLAFSTNLPVIYLSGFLRGIADVMILTSAYTFASVLIPPSLRARRFAWFNATFFLSWGLAGTLVAGPLVDALIASGYAQPWAYRMSFAAGAGLVLIGLMIQAGLMVTIKEKKRS